LSPEICIVVDRKDKLSRKGEQKPTASSGPEGSSPGSDMARQKGHHRGLGAGHAFMGVAQELGRTHCLLAREVPEDKGYRPKKSPGIGELLSLTKESRPNGEL